MAKRILVSGGGALRDLMMPTGVSVRSVRLEGAGALCASGEQLFCACDEGDVIWRLHAQQLVPTALFAGGPGVEQLALSRDRDRLYALCADADSLLMLSAASGAPMMLNRVGVHPCALAMDETGDVLAVAGGACGEAVLLCAHTLCVLRRLAMPGIVCGVALRGGHVYALCLNESLTSTMVTVAPGGVRQTLVLAGMPGTLTLHGRALLAATHEHLYTIASDGARVLGVRDAAGRARRIMQADGQWMLCDSLSEALFAWEASGRWRRLCADVRDVVLL